ncbi:putative ribosomal protein L19 [Rosa chinensis]|uniref:Putative ribosomal protein L19 n=1 Tax=Rosa chinensis TaxID=74649 RepID=A0A2P6P8Y1_ROSCH|nr:putative ribosomal protein L19 [Rosa chinensis]
MWFGVVMCIYGRLWHGRGSKRTFLSCCSSFKSDGGGFHLISVHPDELRFPFELKKESFCDLEVVSNTEHHVAFKVKTSAPMKFFVWPNMGVIKAQDSCIIRVNLRGQRKYPPNMECKDKFLLQSTIVPPNSDIDELPKYTEVPENKRRLSIYKGIVISKQNAGIHTTFRIRRIIAGIGVEIVFPLYSPNIKELKVLSHRKVRRARLYYLRDKLPRFSTFK